MRNEAPALMPILRSRKQAELLTWLILHPHVEHTLPELAERLGIKQSTLHDEVERLSAAGLLSERRVGRSRLVRMNLDSRYARPLSELMTMSFGPAFVVREEFSGLDGVEEVVIYGSWAARLRGRSGVEPADIDVLVVGQPDRADVYAAADRAQDRLGLEVNPTIRRKQTWHDGTDALVASIKAADFIVVAACELGEEPP